MKPLSEYLVVPQAHDILNACLMGDDDSITAAAVDGESVMDLVDRLIVALENEESRSAACANLHELFAKLSLEPHLYERALLAKTINLPSLASPIRLILCPAVFSPELWGRTFAEGLLKNKEQFQGQNIVEVGTGSGWVSLLLLMATKVRTVIGLDLNPIAIKLARLNSWLNGTNSDGTLLLSLAGEPIVYSFRAEVSDLLAVPLAENQVFDQVIGCIPQVLHPNPVKETLGQLHETQFSSAQGLSEQDLYDLSNYCFEQGILEDRFGLPLIARALEQAQLCLKANGKVTLILGGRPGRQAIESMFERRGLSPKMVWVRRIQQADDTDLASLVELEKEYGIKFHFFISRDSEASISASTAVRLLEKNQPIYHDLLVYQASTNNEKQVFEFVRNLHSMNLSSLRKELDFSKLEEERASFLSTLSRSLMETMTLPYPHEKGDKALREILAQYLENFCNYPIGAEDLFVAPSRGQLADIVLKIATVKGGLALISESVRDVYEKIALDAGLDVVVGNDDLAELARLDDLLAPDIVLIAPSQLHSPSPINFRALAQQAKKHPERVYLVDDSKEFDISSHLNTNMTLRFAAQEPPPANLVLLYGLIKNRMFPDQELSFLINAPREWALGLEIGAELSYSRIAYPTQLLYEWLFADLMSFPFQDWQELAAGQELNDEDKSRELPQLSQLIRHLEKDPVFAPKPIDNVDELVEAGKLVRMDYGEFETQIPEVLAKGLLKGFFDEEQRFSRQEESQLLVQAVLERLSAYMRHTRRVALEPNRIALAQGVFPIFGALIKAFAQRLGRAPRVAIADGSYGPLYPMLEYYGAEIVPVKTSIERAYTLSSRDLVFTVKPDILWLTQPGNPSGIFLDPERLRTVIDTAVKQGIYVFSDEIFFLLSDHRLGKWTPASLSVGSYFNSDYAGHLFVADGVAKSFAAGGLRMGFLACPDALWAQQIGAFLPQPPRAVLKACDYLYSAFLEKSPNQLLDVSEIFAELETYILGKRKLLSANREQLMNLLRQYKIDDGVDTPYRGGLFLQAKLEGHYEALAREAGVLCNPPQWSRSPQLSRLCYCLTEEHFSSAMQRLSQYFKVHLENYKK
jgi:aspartate/methionine/tyrosine aminotransferase